MNTKQNYILDFETLFDDIDFGPTSTAVAEPGQLFCAAVASRSEYGDGGRAGMLDSASPTSSAEEGGAANDMAVAPPASPPSIGDRERRVPPPPPGRGPDADGLATGLLFDLASEIPDAAVRWQECADEAEVATCDRRRWLGILRTWKPVLPAAEYKDMQVYRRKIRDRNHANNSRRQRRCAEQGLASEVAQLQAEMAELRAENARLRGLVSGGEPHPGAWAACLQL